ncbi:MAG: carboxypeptidase regulatory-like domain-containing protein [Candidatus Sericytochromatia bacterium]|nr:carboxypeptidase regulatory-like domain-containing protein [Candidatus Sericytochromatia bacterium]
MASAHASSQPLGQKISAYRKKRNLTMQQLAEAVGVSESYISFLESGVRSPSRKLLKKLVHFFYPQGHPALLDEWLLLGCQSSPSLTEGLPSDSLAVAQDLTPGSKGERLRQGVLTGQIQFPPGSSIPAEGVLIRVNGGLQEARSDARGGFRLEQLPLDTPLTLLAEGSDAAGRPFKALSQQMLSAQQPSLALETLLLQQTGSLSGQISLSDGSPPEAIDVYLPGTSVIAKTDAEGFFALPGLPAGQHRLQVYKAGYALGQSELIEIQAGRVALLPPLRLQALAANAPQQSSAQLSGTVRYLGQPLAGVSLALLWEGPPAEAPALTPLSLSNSQGRYQLPLLQPGPYTLVASRNGFETLLQPLEIAAADLRAEGLTQDLQLSDSCIFAGRLAVQVQNCAGQPLPNALIQLDPSPTLGPVPFTDQRGQVLLGPLWPGAYTVYAARGTQQVFESVPIANQPTGSDGQPGALASLSLTLGAPCP